MPCSCCGQERRPGSSLCCGVTTTSTCAASASAGSGTKPGVPDSTPTLPVRDIDEAAAFFESAGFDVRRYEGGGFAFVTDDDESVFDLDAADGFDPAANRAGCYLIVSGVEAWHARLVAAGLPVTELVIIRGGCRSSP